MRQFHHGAERHVPEVRHLRQHDGVQLRSPFAPLAGRRWREAPDEGCLNAYGLPSRRLSVLFLSPTSATRKSCHTFTCARGGDEAKFWLRPEVVVAESFGFNAAELNATRSDGSSGAGADRKGLE